MQKIKKYSCGNGDGMFEDEENGNWIEYLEHKKINDKLGLIHDIVDKQNFNEDSDLHEIYKILNNEKI
jgi:hypothetical protein